MVFRGVPVKRFAVITPAYEKHPGGMGVGPPEYGCDYIEVDAENRRAAKILAVRLWRRGDWRLYVNKFDDQCPFSGLEVLEVGDNE